MITIEELKAYLNIDYADEMIEENLKRCIRTADGYMKSAVAVDYDSDEAKAKELLLIIAADFYDNRNYTENTLTGNTRRLVNNMILQLQLEGREAK